MAGKCPLYEIPLDFIEAHFFQLGGAAGSRDTQAQISGTHRGSGRHQQAAFDGVIEFADVARPRMLMESPERGGVEGGNILAITIRIAVKEMVSKKVDVFTAVT